MQAHRWFWWFAVPALLLVSLGAAAAQPPDPSRMHHTAWRIGDGAPGPVVTLAQTPDGWLWVGTPTGLFRFDGVRFERMEALGGTRLASPAVRSLIVDRQGALWIGYLLGGVARWHDGRLTAYAEREGLPASPVLRIGFDADGSAWAAAVEGLYRLQGDRWQQVGSRTMALDLLIDRSGNLWADSEQQLLRWEAAKGWIGAPQVIGRTSFDDAASLQQGPDGAVWQSDGTGPPRRFSQRGEPLQAPAQPQGQVEPLAFDRDGNAWFVSGDGVRCMPVTHWLSVPRGAALPPAFPLAQLSSPTVNVLLQDHEGTLWLGTQGGLDRLRPNKLNAVAVPEGAPPLALAPAGDGSVWVGTSALGLNLLDSEDRWHQVAGGIEAGIRALTRAPGGSLWFGTITGELWRVAGGASARVPTPTQADPKLMVQSLAVDPRGRLWLAGDGLSRRQLDGSWQPWSGRHGMPDGTPMVLQADEAGRVWAGYGSGRVAVVDAADRVRVYGPEAGLDVGAVTALFTRAGHTWVGGTTGVALLKHGRFRPLLREAGTGYPSVTGILERAEGELWLHGADGISRVAAAEVRKFAAAPGYRPDYEHFDYRDGLPGTAEQVHSLPTMIEAEDGRLWFASTDGLSWIDPRRIQRNPLMPPVAVLGLLAGDVSIPLQGQPALPAHTSRVAIEYTALSLTMPERVHFRYRLDGVDNAWQEAGTERVAHYNNLGPGRYRFQVIASNQDGQWNERGATLAFSIRPALHQTWYFRLAAGLALLALLAALYTLRVRQLALRATERLRIRQLERERIAADLHDTLLQGVYGLLLQMQKVLHGLHETGPRETMQAAVLLAERLVAEGRDRVSGLRRAADGIGDIAQAIRNAAVEVEREHHTPLVVSLEGRPEPLAPEVQEQLYLVVREAMLNAAMHAHARRIEVRLRYEGHSLELQVRDDGRGIPLPVLHSGGRQGHWGLQGMRERTQWMQGRLRIDSAADVGTTVSVRVPLRRADAAAGA